MWPRGRYNGKRIIGFRLVVSVHILRWHLQARLNWGEPFITLGPICVSVRWEYE